MTREVDCLQAPGETHQETLDRLRLEIAELRASRERLVRAADADRRLIERALHDGIHQHLIGLAVGAQLASASVDGDPTGAKALLGQMEHDLQRALDDAVELAQRIYPALLDGGGLGAALRAAAASAGIRASIDVGVAASSSSEVMSSIYLCCLEALDTAGPGATLTARDEDGVILVVVEAAEPWPAAGLERLRDRVEALGGRLTVEPTTAGDRVAAALPLSR